MEGRFLPMNVLHAISKSRIKPDRFLACIEISAGSSCKYELDKESGALVLDRILYTATHYPHNYGFIPKTWGNDDDPLDVLVVSSEPIVPMALVHCYPIGVLEMEDSGKIDEKIIAICEKDPFYNNFKDVTDLPHHLFEEISHFFRVYKELEHGKETIIGEVKGHLDAMKCIERAKARYDEVFPDGR